MFTLHAGLVADGSILFTRQIGHQTRALLDREIAHLDAVFEGHAWLPEIVDLSTVTQSDLDFQSIRGVVRITCETARPLAEGKKIALFSPGDLLFGLSRIHTALVEMSGTQVESAVFRTESELLDWLGRPERSFAELEGFDRVGPLPPRESVANS